MTIEKQKNCVSTQALVLVDIQLYEFSFSSRNLTVKFSPEISSHSPGEYITLESNCEP